MVIDWTDIYKKLNPDIVATSLKAGRFGKVRKRQAKKAGIKFVDINHAFYDKGTTKLLKIFGLEWKRGGGE